jgi:hypothetical protein
MAAMSTPTAPATRYEDVWRTLAPLEEEVVEVEEDEDFVLEVELLAVPVVDPEAEVVVEAVRLWHEVGGREEKVSKREKSSLRGLVPLQVLLTKSNWIRLRRQV